MRAVKSLMNRPNKSESAVFNLRMLYFKKIPISDYSEIGFHGLAHYKVANLPILDH